MNNLTPSAASGYSFEKDPAREIAVTLFSTLATVSAIAVVVGLPFWVNKLATTGIFVLLTAAALWARASAQRGSHRLAMHGFAMVGALLAFPLMALSPHLTAPTLIMATILPAYAAICGRAYALGLGASYIAAAVAVLLAPMAGITFPKLFPTPPVVEIATAAIAIAGIIGPLSRVFDKMRESVIAMEHSNRALRTINQCNQLLAHAATEVDLMQGICRIMVESGGYRMAWVGFAEMDEVRTVCPVASSGFEDNYLEMAKISWADVETGRGPTGTAIRETRPVVLRNTRTQASGVPWRVAALERGYQSAIALPLLGEDKRCFGALTLYAAETDAFDSDELALLSELANDLAFGIRTLRMRAARDDAEAAARYSQALAQAIIEQAPDAIELTDPNTLRFIEVNKASCDLLGYTREERLRQSVPDIQAEMTPDQLTSVTRDITANGGAEFETRHRRKDGRLIDVRVSLRTLRLHDRDHLLAIWRDITAEKAAAAEIRKLSLAIEQNPNSIVITDLDCRIEYVNDAFSRNTGYARQEVVGQTPRILKSGKTPAATYQLMWQTLLRGDTWQGEFANRTRLGLEQIESATIVPLRQSDGRITHYVAIKQDITDKKRQEDQLRKLSMAVEQSPESIVITNRDACIEYVNDAFVRTTGYSRDEALGQNPRLLQSGRTSKAVYDEMWASLSRGELWRGELINRRKDGSEYVEFASLAPIRQPDGQITHYLAIKEDITEKKRMTEELERHRHHLELLVESRTAELRATSSEQQAIFDSANSGIVLLKDRVIQRGNRRLHEMFGWPSGAMIGQKTAVWYPDEAADTTGGGAVYEQIWRGEVNRREQELMRKDGSLFWARLTGTAVDVADHSKGTVWVIEDINIERAAMEQMRQAKTLAEAAARTKADFLANMSHEIRTPMNAVIGMSHLLLRTELAPRQRDYLAKIQGAGQHLLGVINDILDFSKVEAGKLSLERAEFELDKIATDIATLLAEKASDKGLELSIDINPDVPPSLVGDPMRLQQILLNFGSNAVKFTEQGEIRIVVRVKERSQTEALLHFRIQDTGIGLSAEQKGSLFQSFQQADASTTRKFGGTGLGLVIAKRLAEMMGGEVGVESELGRGSVFWFTARLGIGTGHSRALMPRPDLRGLRVLVVDDNDTTRLLLQRQLTYMTFMVDEAASGAKAIEAVRQSALAAIPYAIVFLDWRMPDMDGVETARRIRALELAPSPHLVMLTGYMREEVMSEADQAGIERYLIKPVTQSLLFDTAMQLVGGDRLEQAGPVTTASREAHMLAAIKGARILLVEDNELNQEVARELLTGVGLIVDVAQNGAIAVRRVQQSHYDLVFMDMQMPVMDGVTATVEIRKLAQFKDLPIIAMTANAMQQDRDRCIDAGMNDYLAKPIEPDQLWSMLSRWVKPGPAGIAAQQSGSASAAAVDRLGLTDPLVIPAVIEGFDVNVALRHVAGNAATLLSLLRQFVKQQKTGAEEIRSALDSGDWAAAERLAHTIKGVAGTLGAQGLQDIAGELERLIKARPPRPQLEQPLASLASMLCALIARLEAKLPAHQEPAAPIAVDAAKLGAVSGKLAELLGHDDFAASDLFSDNAELLRAAFPAAFSRIAEAIEAFDFQAARGLLEAARESAGTTVA
jgi:two-component system, sensor histidine kinase and response regulator